MVWSWWVLLVRLVEVDRFLLQQPFRMRTTTLQPSHMKTTSLRGEVEVLASDVV